MTVGRVLVAVVVVAVMVAGCGGGMSNDDAERELTSMLTSSSRTVSSVDCAKDDTGSFQCVVDVATSEGPASGQGTLTCSDGDCVWKPD